MGRSFLASTVILLGLFFVSTAALHAQAPPALTADFYMMQPDQWVDKEVSMNVAWVEIPTKNAMEDEYRRLNAVTLNNGHFGGDIKVYALPDVAAQLIQLCGTTRYRYATSSKMHIIHGKFVKRGDGYALMVTK